MSEAGMIRFAKEVVEAEKDAEIERLRADLAGAEALLRRCRVELNTVSPEVRKLDGEIDAWLARKRGE